jgi:hypothetical protein
MHRRTTRPLRNPSSRKPRGCPLWLILLLFTCSIWARSHTSFCGMCQADFVRSLQPISFRLTGLHEPLIFAAYVLSRLSACVPACVPAGGGLCRNA